MDSHLEGMAIVPDWIDGKQTSWRGHHLLVEMNDKENTLPDAKYDIVDIGPRGDKIPRERVANSVRDPVESFTPRSQAIHPTEAEGKKGRSLNCKRPQTQC